MTIDYEADARRWINCSEGSTRQFEMFLLRSCSDDSYRQPIILTFLAVVVVVLLVFLYVLFTRRRTFSVRVFRHQIFLLCIVALVVRLAYLVLIYLKVFGPANLVLHNFGACLSTIALSMIMYTWCNAYQMMLISQKHRLMRNIRYFLVVYIGIYSAYMVIISGALWAVEDFHVRNYLLVSNGCFVVVSVFVIAGLQMIVSKTFLEAIRQNGLKNNKRIDKAVKKLKKFTYMTINSAVSVAITTVLVLFWIIYTDFVAEYFFFCLIFYYLLVEQFSLCSVLWITTTKKIEQPLESSSTDTKNQSLNSQSPSSMTEIGAVDGGGGAAAGGGGGGGGSGEEENADA